MRSFASYATAVVLALAAAVPAVAQQEFEGWNLEPGISEAHLVMVARVTSISRVTVVEGAKTDIALREFRFQPVRVLKGLFQRLIDGAAQGRRVSPAHSRSAARTEHIRVRVSRSRSEDVRRTRTAA
jgi:hypothetical protein